MRELVCAGLGMLLLILPVCADAAPRSPLSPGDHGAARAAFAAIDAKDWTRARSQSAPIADPLTRKLVFWAIAITPDNNLSFAEYSEFLAANPDWPGQSELRTRAELAMSPHLQPASVVAWFAAEAPRTTNGRMRLGAAQLASGQSDKGAATLRDAWVESGFSTASEKEFIDKYGRFLTSDDHLRRLDRLAWEGKSTEAGRMFARVSPGQRALAQARLGLRTQTGNVDRAISQVPANLQNHPGLVYERVRWRRKKDRDQEARQLLATIPVDQTRPDLWWDERHILARRALHDGQATEAYRIVQGHGLAEGLDFATAEWTAGWIALRFLAKPDVAKKHFTTMYSKVETPVSLARGAYWAGRAAETAGDSPGAESWYRKAALHATTYYGQLAAERLDPGGRLGLPQAAKASPEETAAFQRHELVRAAHILTALGEQHRVNRFVIKLALLRDSPGWQSLAAGLAGELGRPDLAVAVSKQSRRGGNPLIMHGYPTIAAANARNGLNPSVEAPLVLAVVRQESAFNSLAVSPAGARGLMQLMPGTAEFVSKRINLPYSPQRLTADPGYNVALGQAYLSKMLATFNGSYILALAAYNAGPTRAKEWLAHNGDPRKSVYDAIDWVESIPFSETRNYVQRTMENLQVYRSRMANTQAPLTLGNDLTR